MTIVVCIRSRLYHEHRPWQIRGEGWRYRQRTSPTPAPSQGWPIRLPF